MSQEEPEPEKPMKNVYTLGFVSFFTDVSSEMVFSVLPVFILSLPGGSPATLGFIEGIAEAMSYGLRAVSGIFSDKFKKRKPFILLGYGISNIAKPFFAYSSTISHALIIRVTDRVGKGVRTAPRDALISDSVPAERRGEAFGLHRTLDQTGAIIGPLLATGVMILLGWTVKEVFFLSLIPGTIALLIILFGVKEIISDEEGEFKFLAGLKVTLHRRFIHLLGVVTLFSLGAFNFSFILLNASRMGVKDSLIPVVYAVVNVTHTLVAIPTGRMADRIGREKVLVIGYLVFLITVLGLNIFQGNIIWAYVIAAVFGIYMGVVETVQRALIPGYVDRRVLGTAYGVYYLVVGTAFFISNYVVGNLWSRYGLWASASYSSILVVVSIVGLVNFITKKR